MTLPLYLIIPPPVNSTASKVAGWECMVHLLQGTPSESTHKVGYLDWLRCIYMHRLSVDKTNVNLVQSLLYLAQLKNTEDLTFQLSDLAAQ